MKLDALRTKLATPSELDGVPSPLASKRRSWRTQSTVSFGLVQTLASPGCMAFEQPDLQGSLVTSAVRWLEEGYFTPLLDFDMDSVSVSRNKPRKGVDLVLVRGEFRKERIVFTFEVQKGRIPSRRFSW